MNIKEQSEKVVKWTRDWFNNKGENSIAIIGISGGVDSSTSAAILKEAIGVKRIIAVKMPCGVQKDIDYSNKLIEHLGLKSVEINIGNTYEELTKEIRKAEINGNAFFNAQYTTNTPARIRMTTLYGIAAVIGNAYPVNTCQASETLCGYDTIFGDSAGSIAPIARFTKTEVIELAKHFGLPRELYEKVPIDGMSLNEDGTYQTDEQKLGFTYKELDDFIRNGEIGPNNAKIVKQIITTQWKRKIINIDYYDPKLPMFVEKLW